MRIGRRIMPGLDCGYDLLQLGGFAVDSQGAPQRR